MRQDFFGIAASSHRRKRVRERVAEADMLFYLPITLVPRLMLIAVSLLALASLVVAWLGLYADVTLLARDSAADRLLNLDREFNVPTWYQGIALMLCSAILLVIAYSHWRNDRSGYWRWWAALAVGFGGLSLDEFTVIHERLVAPMRAVLNNPGGLLYWTWVLPGLAIVIVLGATFIPFLLSLPAWARNGFVVSGALFVGGALVMEMISGAMYSTYGGDSKLYIVGVHLEEFLEMFGVVVFVRTLLAYIANRGGVLRLVH